MPVFYLKSLAELNRRLPRDMTAREKRIAKAVVKTASRGAKLVRKNVPVAFGELRDSIEASGTTIVADAPHAAAVELGSRPHWVPLDALIRWVKLRGMQGISGRSMKRLSGTTSAKHATSIRADLKVRAKSNGGYNSVDDPVEIAKGIQLAIAKRGTRPHFYMGGSVPGVVDILDELVKEALPDPT